MKSANFLPLVAGLVLLCSSLSAQQNLTVPSSVAMHLGNANLVLTDTDAYLYGYVNNSNARIRFTGSRNMEMAAGGNGIWQLELDMAAGTELHLAQLVEVIEALRFNATDNFLVLDDYSLFVGANAQVQGYGPNNYVVTNGIGLLQKFELGAVPFEFPVGANTTDYNPVILAEQHSPRLYAVRAHERVLANGSTGAALTNGVADVSWFIEASPSSDQHLMVNAQWEGTDELPGFDRTRCGLAYFDSANGWDLTVNDVLPAGGSAPYARERNGVEKSGYFAVGGPALARPGQAEIDVLLGGGYLSAGLMSDALRANDLLPVTEPFSALGFEHKGFGGGETVTPGVFDPAGNNAIVDWVLVEIRETAAPYQVIATKAGLLQRDGDIVDTDGISPLQVAGLPPTAYFVAIQHRNHLGVMTAAPLDFSTGNVEYSFLVDPDQAFGGTNGIADLGDGFYGLISGDYDRNGQVQNVDGTGLTQTLGTPGYQQGDLDLNGQVQNIDLQLKLSPNLGKGRQF